MFEEYTNKQIKGMIESLLKLADYDFPQMKVSLSVTGEAERMDGFVVELETDGGGGADLSDNHVFTVGEKHIGPAWLLLVYLNKAYFKKAKRGIIPSGYEPLTMAIAVEYLHKRNGMSYGEAERIVADVANENIENIKRYRKRKRPESKGGSESLLKYPKLWDFPDDPKNVVREILPMSFDN